MTAARAAAALVGVLTEHQRKPARVVARLAAEHLDQLGMLEDPAEWDDEDPAGHLVYQGQRPDPPTWLVFSKTIMDDPQGPIAVTRDRTASAIEVLGLEPDEVRAVVIEPTHIRVFRWSDRVTAQTMPILPDKETA